jgi:hypothetical protein
VSFHKQRSKRAYQPLSVIDIVNQPEPSVDMDDELKQAIDDFYRGLVDDEDDLAVLLGDKPSHGAALSRDGWEIGYLDAWYAETARRLLPPSREDDPRVLRSRSSPSRSRSRSRTRRRYYRSRSRSRGRGRSRSRSRSRDRNYDYRSRYPTDRHSSRAEMETIRAPYHRDHYHQQRSPTRGRLPFQSAGTMHSSTSTTSSDHYRHGSPSHYW